MINTSKFWKNAMAKGLLHTNLPIPLNSLSINHQKQILKKGKRKRSPHFQFLNCNEIIVRGVCSNSCPFFLKYRHLYNSLYQNGFKFMMALTLEKDLRPLTPKWSDDSASRKTKDCRQRALVTFANARLGILDTKKVLNTQTGAVEMGRLMVIV